MFFKPSSQEICVACGGIIEATEPRLVDKNILTRRKIHRHMVCPETSAGVLVSSNGPNGNHHRPASASATVQSRDIS